jgi:hypothetical protein
LIAVGSCMVSLFMVMTQTPWNTIWPAPNAGYWINVQQVACQSTAIIDPAILNLVIESPIPQRSFVQQDKYAEF